MRNGAVTRGVVATVLAAASLLGGETHATVIAQASAGRLDIVLTDLDPTDGIAPALTFLRGDPWHLAYRSRNASMDGRTILQNSAGKSDPPAELAGLPDWGVVAQTSAPGDFASGFELASAQLPSGTAHQFKSRADTRLYSSFSVTPMTAIRFVTSASLSASSVDALAGDSAAASIGFQLLAADGPMLVDAAIREASVRVTALDAGPTAWSTSEPLVLDFFNRSHADNDISLVMYLSASVVSTPSLAMMTAAAAAPEPATPALIALALCAVALRRRPPAQGGSGAAGCCGCAWPQSPPGRPPR
ncbi:MAG: PEP-CTERM sorting domain-containing protein [Gammaproteobacteria bacterium]